MPEKIWVWGDACGQGWSDVEPLWRGDHPEYIRADVVERWVLEAVEAFRDEFKKAWLDHPEGTIEEIEDPGEEGSNGS